MLSGIEIFKFFVSDHLNCIFIEKSPDTNISDTFNELKQFLLKVVDSCWIFSKTWSDTGVLIYGKELPLPQTLLAFLKRHLVRH